MMKLDPVWVPYNPNQPKSQKFMCSCCGEIVYYPQNHYSKERGICPYRFCPMCGKEMANGGKRDK